jgi:hypothetical protein
MFATWGLASSVRESGHPEAGPDTSAKDTSGREESGNPPFETGELLASPPEGHWERDWALADPDRFIP